MTFRLIRNICSIGLIIMLTSVAFYSTKKCRTPRFHRYAVLSVLGAHFATIISPLCG